MNGMERDAMVSKQKLAWCLLILRMGIATVFAMWTIDKFINPSHAAAVFERFYQLSGLTSGITYAIGVAQSALILAFLVGLFRTFSYGAILILHAISTVSSYMKYMDPWTYPNLLFFAAIPMLSACIVLWVLRTHDAYTLDAWRMTAKLDQVVD